MRRRAPLARCGIIGMFAHEDPVAADLYEGLLMLQHRGQDSAGMVTTDWSKFVEHRGNGLVRDVFADDSSMSQMKGAWHSAVSLIACLTLPVSQHRL